MAHVGMEFPNNLLGITLFTIQRGAQCGRREGSVDWEIASMPTGQIIGDSLVGMTGIGRVRARCNSTHSKGL